MKPAKNSVAVVVRGEGGAFLIVRRPGDPEDPLAGAWGLPAITLGDGEDERAAVVRAGLVKLGVRLAVGRKLGEKTADRGAYLLRLADYEATITGGTPSVPQKDTSLTQYEECVFARDPRVLDDAAARGSLCAQVFLEALSDLKGSRMNDPEKLLARLGALDACAVSDALDRLGLPGSVPGLRSLSGARLAGLARTVQVGPADGGGRHIATETVEDADPGDVVVIAGGGRVDVACWGGILTAAAQLRGVAGVVVDGAVRDVDETAGAGFPVFARAATTRTARGRITQVAADDPVDFAGVRVEVGDLVIADGSGVVFVPADRAAEALTVAERISARQARVLDRVRAGEPVTALMSDSSLTEGV
jgi:regulator of RNase E activity RraA